MCLVINFSLRQVAILSLNIKLRTRFDYKSVCNQFTITHCVVTYKTIHIYYLRVMLETQPILQLNLYKLTWYIEDATSLI
jgi:hypothetical protein